MKVNVVDPKFIVNMWKDIKPYLQRALEHTDDYSVEQCKVFLTNGSWTLFVAVDEDVIHGIATVAVENGVNHRTAVITTISGKGIVNKEAMEQLMNILKSYGITRIQGYARDSLVRLYHSFGIYKKSNLVEVTL